MPRAADLAAGRDRVLEAAAEYLLGQAVESHPHVYPVIAQRISSLSFGARP